MPEISPDDLMKAIDISLSRMTPLSRRALAQIVKTFAQGRQRNRPAVDLLRSLIAKAIVFHYDNANLADDVDDVDEDEGKDEDEDEDEDEEHSELEDPKYPEAKREQGKAYT